MQYRASSRVGALLRVDAIFAPRPAGALQPVEAQRRHKETSTAGIDARAREARKLLTASAMAAANVQGGGAEGALPRPLLQQSGLICIVSCEPAAIGWIGGYG